MNKADRLQQLTAAIVDLGEAAGITTTHRDDIADCIEKAEKLVNWPPARNRLPRHRQGFTQEARIAGHKVFVRTGEYEDGTLGEIFIDMHKQSTEVRSLLSCYAISFSLALQYGVPLEQLVDQFAFTRFSPSGHVTGDKQILICTSVIDYVMRVIGVHYLKRTDLAHVIVEPALGQPAKPVEDQAPACDNCGHITVRNGNGYKCLNCGQAIPR